MLLFIADELSFTPDLSPATIGCSVHSSWGGGYGGLNSKPRGDRTRDSFFDSFGRGHAVADAGCGSGGGGHHVRSSNHDWSDDPRGRRRVHACGRAGLAVAGLRTRGGPGQ